MPVSVAMNKNQALAAAIGRQVYGFRPTAVAPLGRGLTTFRLEFGGLPAKVLRLPGRVRAIRREQRVLRKLRQARWGLPVPAIEFTERDLPTEWEAGDASWRRPDALLIMRHEPGMPLSDAILRGERWAGEAMRAAGALLARLAEFPTVTLGRAPAGAPAVFTHGRLGADRILVEPVGSGVRLCIVNWTHARLAPPLTDLAALLASVARLPLGDAGQAAYLRRHAIDGFAALHPLEGLEVRLAELAMPA